VRALKHFQQIRYQRYGPMLFRSENTIIYAVKTDLFRRLKSIKNKNKKRKNKNL